MARMEAREQWDNTINYNMKIKQLNNYNFMFSKPVFQNMGKIDIFRELKRDLLKEILKGTLTSDSLKGDLNIRRNGDQRKSEPVVTA